MYAGRRWAELDDEEQVDFLAWYDLRFRHGRMSMAAVAAPEMWRTMATGINVVAQMLPGGKPIFRGIEPELLEGKREEVAERPREFLPRPPGLADDDPELGVIYRREYE